MRGEKLLMVDGSNLLFQMFFGMPSRIVNREGKAIQGTLGFVGALLKIIRRTDPTHIAVIFDGEHPNGRTLLDEGYKANRPDYSQVREDGNPFSQLPDIYAALDFLGIPYAETADCEADDILAGYALTYGQDMEMVISSFDSDLFQLITDRVSVLRYRGERTVLCTPTFIREHLGIRPDQYADFKSLTGDASDHIRGAEKIGVKTAAALLNTFGSLANLLERAEEITKPAIRESVIRNAGRLKNNYRLIRLEGGHPLPFSLPELIYLPRSVTTGEVLTGIGLK